MEYEVILETTAIRDLYGILDYITDVLKSPQAAQRVFSSIEKQVMSLGHMPERHSIVREEPYATIGVRLIPVENYNAFYVVDNSAHEVRILRILYNRREWQRLL